MEKRQAPSFGANTLFDGIVRSTQDRPVVEQVAKSVRPIVNGALDGNRWVKNFLHGTWVGHPLHPVLTDIPIGAWSMAALFDVLSVTAPAERRQGHARAADVCVKAGIAGAIGAAITGLADWSDTSGRPARVGVIHAATNSLALTSYIASALLRKRRRGAAILVSFAGLGLVIVGAGLGGHLVFGEQQGVNRAVAHDLPMEFVRVLPVDELIENVPHRAELRGRPIVLVKQGPEVYAILDTCSHMGGPLSKGTIEDCSIRCPWHGSRFSLENGRVLEGPASMNQPAFQARVIDGFIEVRAFEPEAP